MVTIIIYLADKTYVDRTIEEIFDKTPPLLIDEIIVCDDNNQDYSRDTFDRVRIIKTNNLGRATCWNQAVAQSSTRTQSGFGNSDHLVFLRDTTKLSADWLQPLLNVIDENPQVLVSPRVHSLDTELWATEDECWQRFGWRWDLTLYNRKHVGQPESPAISNYCIATSREWFDKIGGFDEGMKSGAGEDIEISLRTWLFGGAVQVSDDSYIAVRHQVDAGRKSLANAARIVEVWLSPYTSRFLAARGVAPGDVKIGRLNKLIKLQGQYQVRSADWFISTIQPELGQIYDLCGSATGKSVAVVGHGPSVDMIDPALINRHDIIIGVDYMGFAHDCDYVVTDSAHIVVSLRAEYPNSSFVVPFFLFDKASAKYVHSGHVVDGCVQFELGELGDSSWSNGGDASPPFCNFDQSLHSAIQFALFLNPRAVTLFGCDTKLISGKSHSAKIGYYDDGCMMTDSENTRQRFAYSEYGLGRLGDLAGTLGIPLIRVNHA